ncbi:uncharacterized protein RSE6_08501 [Rhynchosporium secalis]|uniref:MARVEL domain-containing protein n=1 Tax=Rhynchosporium secalis TaxID=38038 RepID=A0A1E1MFK6_RHYSE|nr:uncharacterized protein RSE6_08501 [Rhynchosporium secalis]
MTVENFDIERSDQEMIHRTLVASISFWLTIIRLLQIALSFTVLFCIGFTAHILLGDWFHTFGLSFVTFIVAMLFMTYAGLRWASKVSLSLPIQSPHVSIHLLEIDHPNDLTNVITSAMEIFVTCLWIATVALLSWECQTWDAASDIVGDFLSSELAAMAEALPNQDMGILSLQAATALASINCVFWAFTLFMCKCNPRFLEPEDCGIPT